MNNKKFWEFVENLPVSQPAFDAISEIQKDVAEGRILPSAAIGKAIDVENKYKDTVYKFESTKRDFARFQWALVDVVASVTADLTARGFSEDAVRRYRTTPRRRRIATA